MTSTKTYKFHHPAAARLQEEWLRLSDVESDIQRAQQAVRTAEKAKRTQLARIGAEVRSVRVVLGISAEDMSRRFSFDGGERLQQYVDFEDTGRIQRSATLESIVGTLLGEAQRLEPIDEPTAAPQGR